MPEDKVILEYRSSIPPIEIQGDETTIILRASAATGQILQLAVLLAVLTFALLFSAGVIAGALRVDGQGVGGQLLLGAGLLWAIVYFSRQISRLYRGGKQPVIIRKGADGLIVNAPLQLGNRAIAMAPLSAIRAFTSYRSSGSRGLLNYNLILETASDSVCLRVAFNNHRTAEAVDQKLS